MRDRGVRQLNVYFNKALGNSDASSHVSSGVMEDWVENQEFTFRSQLWATRSISMEST